MATAKQIKARELFAKRAKAGAFARKGKRAKNPTKKFPSEMTAAEINKALDKLDIESSKYTDALIDAGRGHEKLGDIVKQKDPLSLKVLDNLDRRMQLRAEIDRRYGPGAPSRLPTHKRGAFGPRRANPATPEYDDNPTGTGSIILDQLGGHRFIAMTGAKQFVGSPHFLGFTIPRNKSGANKVTITLNLGSDLYTMKFYKVKRGGLESDLIREEDDVYAEQMREIFESVTGLYTSLGTMGRERNPRARAQRFQFVGVENEPGAFTYGMDAVTPVTFVFRARESKRDYRSFQLPADAVANPAFQEWANSIGGRKIASLQELRRIIKGFA